MKKLIDIFKKIGIGALTVIPIIFIFYLVGNYAVLNLSSEEQLKEINEGTELGNIIGFTLYGFLICFFTLLFIYFLYSTGDCILGYVLKKEE